MLLKAVWYTFNDEMEDDRMILVTGGARSGKSRYAEQLTMAAGGRWLYIATGKVFDAEMARRVEKHKERRGDRWDTYEDHRRIDAFLREHRADYQSALLDCVTTFLTDILFDSLGDVPEDFDFSKPDYDRVQEEALAYMGRVLDAADEASLPLILVTNEIGMGVIPDTPLGRAFRDMAGIMNQYLAERAEAVYLMVSGIPVRIKGS